ncbi:hypothetical protein HMPREF1410_00442 [Helicobacter pylori GAM249T]|nr:hypothetical protein HMPREF1410_00442 [Helicobacter pylori GAM249T]
MILLPLPHYPFYPFRRYIPIKIIVSALILCKNYCYEYLSLGKFQ